jgi:23S rRNA pseudouridine2605 synthase
MLERLQKIIARAGIASRRHAEELIRSGQVKVNGVVVTELGTKADPERDHIEAAGHTVELPAAPSYFILHKPPHVVSTMFDPEGRATLRHVLRGLAGGVFPVGRLDYAASGLIFLTSDGQLANAILKASSNLVQVFWVKLKGRPSPETLAKVTHRAQARLRLLPAPEAAAGHVENPWYEAELRGVRRSLLRQAFFDAGHPVEKMKRVRFGPLELGNLPEGQYRQLAPSEVESLRRAVERAARGGERVAPPAPPIAVRPFQRKKWRPSGGAGRKPVPRGGAGERRPSRPGRGRFAPPAAAGPPGRGGRPRFQPRGERAGPRGERGERRFPPRARPRGEKPFQPRRDRGGPGGFGRPKRQGDQGRGYPSKGPRGPGAGKFSRGGARPAAPGPGKFRGKQSPGRPGGRPPGRPPRRPNGRKNVPPGKTR